MLTLFRSIPTTLLPCLTALTLLSALPAGAQTLTLGSQPSVTPKTSGSATISASGTAATGTAAFTGGASAATTSYRGVVLLNTSALDFQDGGTINSILFNENNSTANIYGGNIKFIYGYDASITNIYGGTVFYPEALGSSLGGSLGTSKVNIYGGTITYLATQNAGTMDVFGTGLTETFLGNGGGFDDYSVTGTLQDGTALNVLYGNNSGTLLFNGQPAVPIAAVPEASTIVSLGLLLALGVGGMVSARKKRLVA